MEARPAWESALTALEADAAWIEVMNLTAMTTPNTYILTQ